MDSENPLVGNIEECFSEQISTLALTEAIGIVSKDREGRFNYLSFSIQIPTVDTLAVLEQNGKTDTFQYYWEKPSDNFSIAAAGSVYRLKTTGEKRFRVASDQGKQLLDQVYH